ncbi:MAG TPA: PQQ-binding-like beta-propeller repeat protein [Propionicimonas sp.]|nr:PQQ-binding-like beta-propeller repeat protein [Propionicimonas sp.]
MANQPGQRQPFGPALWAGLVVVGLLVLTATLGRPLALPAGGGAAWLPPDGHRQRFAGPDGVHVSEWAFDQTPSLLANGPAAFASWMRVTQIDLWSATLARRSTVHLNGSGEVVVRTDDLFSLGSDGIRAEVVGGLDGSTRAYRPGRLDLPDNLAGGRTWTSEGAVLVTDPSGKRTTHGYRAEYAATPTADRALLAKACLVVTLREQIGTGPAATGTRTWCRRAGFIAYSAEAGAWQATATTPAPVSPEAPFDWANADRLTFSSLRVNQPGTVGNIIVSPITPPGILPDGSVVATSQAVADVTSFRTDTEPPALAWLARPGVRTTTAATFGATTVVAGANRQLVAYGPAGEWLWEVRLPDLSVVPPARIGDLVVVATLDGSVTAYHLGTGAKAWQQRMATEVRAAPVVGGDRVLVVDQGGQLACFDGAGVEQWNVQVGEVRYLAVTPGANPVVVVPNSDGPRVTGLALADGRELWRPRLLTNDLSRNVIALDGVTLLRGSDETVGIDPSTGAPLWTWSARRTYAAIGGGDRALLLADDRLVLLDGRGAQVAEWPVVIGDPASTTTWLSASDRWVFVVGSSGASLGVLR